MRVDVIISALSFASTLLFITVIAASVLLTMGILTLPKECAALYIQEFALIATLPEFATVAGNNHSLLYALTHSLLYDSIKGFMSSPRTQYLLVWRCMGHIYWTF